MFSPDLGFLPLGGNFLVVSLFDWKNLLLGH